MKKDIKLLVLDVDGTLTDGGIYVLEDGSQFKKFNAKDGLGIRMAIKKGIDVAIISHSLTAEMVTTRANMLGMKYVYVGQRPKIDILNEWLKDLLISKKQVAYVGDDLNDLDIINAVGFSACPADAAQVVKKEVDVILKNNGGYGAVREFIDCHLLID